MMVSPIPRPLVQLARLPVLALTIVLALTALPARAEESSEYEGYVRQAVIEVEQGNWDEARALFRRAHEISPNARTWRGLGISAFETRQYVDAIAELEAALADPRKPLTPEQREEVKGVLGRARDFISVFRVQVQPAGAEVLVDGEPAELKEDVLYLDPGPHTVIVRAPGYEERQAHVRANAGEQEELAIELRVTGQERDRGMTEAERPDLAAEAEAEAEPTPPRRRIATWVLAGATVAGAATAIGLGVATRSKHDDFAACGPSDACRGLSDDGKRLQLLTNVAFGVTGALAVGAVVSYFLEGRGRERAHTRRALLVPTHHGMEVRGSF